MTSAVLVPDMPTSPRVIDVCSVFPSACISSDDEVTDLRTRTSAVSPPAAATEAAASPSVPATPIPEPLPTMVVRPGDTLVALAQWFGITPFDIAATNGFPVDDYLQIGAVLAIPVSQADFAMPPEPQTAVAAAEEEAPAPTPAPAPQPTPPPVTPAPYIPPSSEQVIAAICSLPWPCEKMVRIASCESGLNPRALNPAGYYGLFQISNFIDGWDDPVINATFAYEYKYLPALARGGDGLSPWPVCRYY